jgi:hypothetical protein
MTTTRASTVAPEDELSRQKIRRRDDEQPLLQPGGNRAQAELLSSGEVRGLAGPLTAHSLQRLQRTVGNRAVTQLLAGQRARPAVQRMGVHGTNWGSATSASHSSGGAVGVIIFNDGVGPVAVKAGEDFLSEAAIAAVMLSHATAGGAGGWTATAPEARPVGGAEAKVIRTKAAGLLPPSQTSTSRTQGFMQSLDDNNGVMVYGFAQGEEISAHLKQSQTVEIGQRGKRAVDPNSMSFAIMNDPGLLETFGRAAAADILLGNSDRFVGKINLENAMVDLAHRTISLIDNVEAGDPAVLRDMPQYQMTGKAGFLEWAKQDKTKKMAAQEWGPLSAPVIKNLGDEILKVVGPKDGKTIQKAYQAKMPAMQKWFEAGLFRGAREIRQGLRNPLPFVQTIEAGQQQQVATNLLARWYFLLQATPDEAWGRAEGQTGFMFIAPNRPATGPAPAAAPAAPAAAATAPARAAGGWRAGVKIGKR